MPDINTLKNQYFVQPSDAAPPERPEPATHGDSKATPLIDGEAYFTDLEAELAGLGGANASDEFIYIGGWWVDLFGFRGISNTSSGSSASPTVNTGMPFKLDGPGGSVSLVDVLKQKANAGVDVRILGWVAWAMISSSYAQSQAGGFRNVNLSTIYSIDRLRKDPNFDDKCCLNTIGHTMGAVHSKFVVLGSESRAAAYTGGIDFEQGRWDTNQHSGASIGERWHDIQVKVEGPAVQPCYDFYRSMWNEVVGRTQMSFDVDGIGEVENYVTGTPTIASKTLSTADVGDHHVQSLRTLPQFNYAWYNFVAEGSPLSFAPNGMFEVEAAWLKAIGGATEYVYIEDQSFWSETIMEALNEQLRSEPTVKVIFLIGAPDPSDPPMPPFRRRAFVEDLLEGNNPPTTRLSSGERDRVGVFGRQVVVHSKTTIVDDQWLLIGSANCTERSLYTDIEHCVSALDEAGTLVPEYRKDLWAEHFGLTGADVDKIADLSKALFVWDNTWGAWPSGAVSLPGSIGRLDLAALPTTPLTDEQQEMYKNRYDFDSREDWGVLNVL